MAITINRRPTHADVTRALREIQELWRPPDPNDNARRAPGAGDTRLGNYKPDFTPTGCKRKAAE